MQLWRGRERADWAKGAVRVFLASLFLFVGYQAVRYSLYKYVSLGYSSEFCYYFEMAASLLDPHLSEVYNFNQFGQNIFGYAGLEGTAGFFQSVHFEPIKYLYAPLYSLTGRVSALFVFISALYFSPLLYLAWIAPLRSRSERWMAAVWGLLYVLYPPTMEVVSFDLRPRALLGPAMLLLLLAVLYRRPLWEKAAALVFLFLVREEAILIAPFLILIDWLGEDSRPKRRAALITLGVIWLAGTAAAFGFFGWSGFESRGRVFQTLGEHWPFFGVAGLLGLLLIALAVRHYRSHDQDQTARRRLQVIAFLALTALFFGGGVLGYYSAYQRTSISGLFKYLSSEFVYTARLSILFAALWGLVGLLWYNIAGRYRKIGVALMVVLAAVSAFGLYQIFPQIKADFNTDRDRYMVPEHAVEVWQLRDATDRNTTAVLWDEATMFAFCDYEHGYGLHRLPYFVVQDEDRLNYPQNEDVLKALVAERIEVIVIHHSSQPIVEGLLADLGIVPREIQVSEFGGRYLIYWIK